MPIYYELRVVAKKIGLSPRTLKVWIEEGLIEPRREGRKILFAEDDLKRLFTIRRLRDDLGVNLAGIDIILQLLDRLAEMQAEINRLKRALQEKETSLPSI